MAAANPMSEITASPESAGGELLVLLAPMSAEQLEEVFAHLSASFSPGSLLVATPDALAAESFPAFHIVPAPAAKASVTLTAADFVNAHQLALQHNARATLILGPESASLGAQAIWRLGNAVLAAGTDLATPSYQLPAHAGLVNSAILYPLSRTLFAPGVRFPLAIDLGLSRRMADRLAAAAQRFATLNQSDVLLWPAGEAAISSFTIHEVDAGPRALPQPTDPDVNSILVHVTGSLFAEIDAKAAFWQRPRRLSVARHLQPHAPSGDAPPDIAPMLEAFHLAYSNLREIWSLVLPPNSLLGLKRLAESSGAAFVMPESLWARIVYDFLLAFRLRTINRGHLLGALIPLYFAWVASHINVTAGGMDPERHIEAIAAAFEAEKPYLVSRWRWPDRFNP